MRRTALGGMAVRFQLWVRIFTLITGFVAATLVWAHHSVAGVFDAEQTFEITGVIMDVEWINPHVYLYLDVADGSGNITPWRLETLPTAFLRKGQITKAMLSGDGEPVTVTGIAAHKDPNLGWVHRITYSDGHYYQLGTEAQSQTSTFPSQ